MVMCYGIIVVQIEPLYDMRSCQDVSEETKRMNAMAAGLRRLCTPKPASGKLEVSADIHKQWLQGGKSRKALLDIFIKNNADKEGLARAEH